MLLIDGLLLAPFKGLQWVFEKIHDAALEERAGEADAITEQLRQLYTMVETGQITEAEFETRERDLLDRFDQARQWQPDPEDFEADEEGEHEETDLDPEDVAPAGDMEEPREHDERNDDGADE